MTTIAFDGRFMAADSLMTDGYNSRSYTDCKMFEKDNYVIGFSGRVSYLLKWKKTLRSTLSHVLEDGFPGWDSEKNAAEIIVVCRHTLKAYCSDGGEFMPVEGENFRGGEGALFYAIGGGSAYALSALACGKNAQGAVSTAMRFHAGTGGSIRTIDCLQEQK